MNDKRYAINLEFCGYSDKRYVVRFCGQFIGQSANKFDAILIQKQHNLNRL